MICNTWPRSVSKSSKRWSWDQRTQIRILNTICVLLGKLGGWATHHVRLLPRRGSYFPLQAFQNIQAERSRNIPDRKYRRLPPEIDKTPLDLDVIASWRLEERHNKARVTLFNSNILVQSDRFRINTLWKCNNFINKRFLNQYYRCAIFNTRRAPWK